MPRRPLLLAAFAISMLLLVACSSSETLIAAGTSETTDGSTTSTTDGEGPGTAGGGTTTSLPGGLSPVAEETAKILEETFDTTATQEECLQDALLANPDLFATVDDPYADPELIAEALEVTMACLDEETVAAYFAQGLLDEVPDLTSEQVDCLTEGFLSLPPETLTELILLDSDPTASPSDDTIVATFELLAGCDLGSVFAEDLGIPGLTDEQAECFADGIFSLEADLLVEMIEAGEDAGAETMSPELMSAILELAADCDIDLASL